MKRRFEREFQTQFIKNARELFPGIIILKNDPEYILGFPDLTLLYGDKWAVLEIKRSGDESFQPNQQYYIDFLNEWSYGAVVYPENEQEVLNELQRLFRA